MSGPARVVVVGAGPGGALLAFLLAREGVEVLLFERQVDFEREFRGEILMPSGMEVFEAAGLGPQFASVPSRAVERLEAWRGARRLFAIDTRTLVGAGNPVPRTVSQPALLEMLAREGARFPTFRLERGARFADLVTERGRVVGVRWSGGSAPGSGSHREPDESPGSPLREDRADLVVGADGRFSSVRGKSGLGEVASHQAFDVVWCKVPMPPSMAAEPAARVYLGGAHFAVAIPTSDGLLQVGWVIRKGDFGEIRRRGVDSWLEELAGHVSPDFAEHLRRVKGEAVQPFLLSVVAGSLESWTRPGLLLLGDAAHPMSPVGGQGLNMALRDAVVAANRLLPPLLGGEGPAAVDRAAEAAAAERRAETGDTQARQRRVPRVLFERPRLSRFLIDGLGPLLVRTGLAQRFLASNLRAFARGTADVRFEPPERR